MFWLFGIPSIFPNFPWVGIKNKRSLINYKKGICPIAEKLKDKSIFQISEEYQDKSLEIRYSKNDEFNLGLFRNYFQYYWNCK